MKYLKNVNSKNRKAFIGIAVFSLVLSLAAASFSLINAKQKAIEHGNFILGSETNKIQYTIDSRLLKLEILEMLVIDNGGMIDDFDTIAKKLYAEDPSMNSIQLAPDGVVTYIYPLEGNENAAGNLFNGKRAAEARYARDSGNMTLSGPFELTQGGVGFVARRPIYLEKGGEKQFWGFSVEVMYSPELFDDAHLENLVNDGYSYQIFQYKAGTKDKLIIAGDKTIAAEAITSKINVPGHTWYLSIVPAAGWLSASTFVFTGIAVVAFLAFILTLAALITSNAYAVAMRDERDKVEKANADRTEFFARMSHDMRTPMNGILGMVRLTAESDNLQEIHENMRKAKESSEYMLSLINDTLDLQRLESKRMKLNPEIAYAKDFFESVFSIFKISAEEKNIDFRIRTIDVDMNSYIEIDKIRMKQILNNLISNAIKFTPEGGTVQFTVECLGDDELLSHMKFTISDTGIGMSKSFIQNELYKPYAQENNELTSQMSGSGLGLAITKNLVEIMGGRIEVESEPGAGTTFTIYLDSKNVPEETARTQKQEKEADVKQKESSLQGKRILLCEDHPLNAEIARRLLEKVGCVVEWAENGQLGVDRFAESPAFYFDAILMDIRMPVMDGNSAAKEMRRLQRRDSKTIPIIAMTANAYESDIKASLDAGMNAHITKPVEPSKLYAAIAAALQNDFDTV